MEPMKPMEPMQPMQQMERWWRPDLGEPSASGSQNDLQFAFFADKQKLAVKQGEQVKVYDSGDHKVSGVSDHQGFRAGLGFRSQKGEFDLDELREA